MNHKFLTDKGWESLADYSTESKLVTVKRITSDFLGNEVSTNTVTKISSIKPIGIQEVWDITVEEDHSYIAHNMCHHNSSSNPNFQNIPREAHDFKECLLADPGMIIVKADLAQAEFRCWAHYSQDEKLISDIESGLDIHKKTASESFGVPIEEVTKEQRTAAKGIVFGLMFGRGTRAIAIQCGITIDEAEAIKRLFFSRYPKAANWLDLIVREGAENKQVRTWLGRIRRVPEIDSEDSGVRAEAERQLKNSPIQGLSSDMNNYYMVRSLKLAHKYEIKSYPMSTVHDANAIQVEEMKYVKLIKIMKHVVATSFPEFRCKMLLDFEIGYTLGTLEPWKEN